MTKTRLSDFVPSELVVNADTAIVYSDEEQAKPSKAEKLSRLKEELLPLVDGNAFCMLSKKVETSTAFPGGVACYFLLPLTGASTLSVYRPWYNKTTPAAAASVLSTPLWNVVREKTHVVPGKEREAYSSEGRCGMSRMASLLGVDVSAVIKAVAEAVQAADQEHQIIKVLTAESAQSVRKSRIDSLIDAQEYMRHAEDVVI